MTGRCPTSRCSHLELQKKTQQCKVYVRHEIKYIQNANETLLQHRMENFHLQNNNIFSQVAWRPFHIQSFRYQGCTVRKVLNIFYTLFIFLLIIFGYTSNIIACQARLDVKHKVLAFLFFKVELF